MATRKRDSSNTEAQACKLFKPDEKAPTARIISDTNPAKGRDDFVTCVKSENCSSVLSFVALLWYTMSAKKAIKSTRITSV